jgi:hypothetical protein
MSSLWSKSSMTPSASRHGRTGAVNARTARDCVPALLNEDDQKKGGTPSDWTCHVAGSGAANATSAAVTNSALEMICCARSSSAQLSMIDAARLGAA